MIVFSANDENARKRKRCHRACTQCRGNKKRCLEYIDSRCQRCQERNLACSFGSDATSPDEENGAFAPQRGSGEATFVGELNPLHALLEASVRRHRIGVWVQHRAPNKPTLDPPLAAYIDAVGATKLPPRTVCDALLRVYYDTFDDLLPLVPRAAVEAQWQKGTASRLLIQAMLLATCRHDNVSEDLLQQPTRVFARDLFTNCRALLYSGYEPDKLNLSRAMAL